MNNPINKLKTHVSKNFPMNSKGVYHLNSMASAPGSQREATAQNRMIETPSFIIPSPKTTLNNLGYLSEEIRVRAATESVAQIVAQQSIIYEQVRGK